MTIRRSAQISLSETPYYHCIARCVRRAFLCGKDHYTGKNFNHRRSWLVDRLKLQSSTFGIDICAYAIMDNHYHVVLRVDEARVKRWSDKEVMERWTHLFHGPLLVQRKLAGKALAAAERATLEKIVTIWRGRLCDISWFMRCLNEHIARRANQEDECTGRFWEGRFKSIALLDEAALLSCMAYVDLNPVRSGKARTLKESDFTSIQARLKEKDPLEASPINARQNPPLSPFSTDYLRYPHIQRLPIKLMDYIALVEATGRCIRSGKRGTLGTASKPALDRLSMKNRQWLELVCEIQASSMQAIGALERIRSYAAASGRSRVMGSGKLLRIYKAA